MSGFLARLLLPLAALAALVWPRPAAAASSPAPLPLAGNDAPLGVRNRNPGNLRRNAFLGFAGVSEGYAVFESVELGVRAATRQIKLYMLRDGLRTVRAIAERWAPDHENPTDAYVSFLAARLGRGADQVLDFPGDVPPLMRAIFHFELGGPIERWVPAGVVDRGIERGLADAI